MRTISVKLPFARKVLGQDSAAERVKDFWCDEIFCYEGLVGTCPYPEHHDCCTAHESDTPCSSADDLCGSVRYRRGKPTVAEESPCKKHGYGAEAQHTRHGEYRKIKRPFSPTACAYPAPPAATSQLV